MTKETIIQILAIAFFSIANLLLAILNCNNYVMAMIDMFVSGFCASTLVSILIVESITRKPKEKND